MAVKTGDAITVSFTTQRFDTGAAANADSLPTGTLYVNGVSNAATVTVTNTTTGQYRAAVTLPTITTGDRCEIAIAATVNSVAGRGIVWRDACDIATDSTGRVTVGSNADKTGYTATVSDKTGFSLASNGLANVTSWTVSLTGSLSGSVGSVTGNVGGITGVTFPATVASPTNITAATGIVLAATTHTGARIPNVTLVDTTTTNTDMRGTDGAALASNWTATRAGYLDSVLIAANNNRTVFVTGSQHVAADMHESQSGSIHTATFDAGALTDAVFAANSITAAKVASDVGAEIATAVRSELAVELARIDANVGSRSTLTATQAADAVLTRGAANVETTAEAYSITDMLLGVFESKVEAGTWIIYRTDGSTTHRTKTITTDAGAEPITRVQ